MPSVNWPTTARNLSAGVLVCAALSSSSAPAVSLSQPLQFFSGRTEMISTVKVFAKKPYRSRTLGVGKILDDGSLALIQEVFDEGRAPERRSWKIRQLGPHRYGGTMSEAVGPVVVDEVKGRYRFKFRMKGNLAIEQWLTPVEGGDSARSNLTVRKFGIRVASSTGVVHRL
jgi:hypothetical protein